MTQNEIDDLEKCINILAHGGSINDCLRQYPTLSPEVQANLKVAYETMQLGDTKLPAKLMENSQARLLERAASYRATGEKQRVTNETWLLKLRRAFSSSHSIRLLAGRIVMVLGITALLIIFSRGLVITSAKSLPGDSLYPVKRAVEDIQVYLITNQQNKLEYEEDFNQERVGEVISLVDLKRIQQVSFEGVLEEMSASQWMVSGIPVTIQADTALLDGITGKAEFTIGSEVEIEGTTNSTGGVNASEIHLREYLFDGVVEKIEKNAWQISGYKLPVTSGTKIEDGIHVGDEVVVVVHSDDSGFFALSIQSIGPVTPLPGFEQPPLNTPMHEDDATEIHENEHHDPEASITPQPTESPDHHDEEEHLATPVVTGEEDHISTPVPQTTEEYEHEGSTATPENQTSAEPTDTHEGEP